MAKSSVILYLILQLLLLGQVESDGQGEIQVTKYVEPKCSSECYRWFRPLTIIDEDGTILKRLSSLKFESSNTPIADQSSATSAVLKSPITITVPTDKDIYISATIVGGGNVVGGFQNVRVPFTKISLSNEWTQKTKSITITQGRKAQLTLNYRLVRCSDHFTGDKCDRCEESYHTDRCDVECVPDEGSYTCDEDTGLKNCETGKIGDECKTCAQNYYPEGKCTVVCEPGGKKYKCLESGAKECLGNRAGDECEECKAGFTGEECDKCAQNYYPEGICTVICKPEENKYTCLDSGTKECLGHRTGDECEECTLNYYGGDCEKFCENSSTYTCDQAGSKNCRTNYFNPEEECETHCDPTQGSYTCNLATGEKICEPGKKGENCEQCENYNKIEPDCEECKQHFFGGECTKNCEAATGYTCNTVGDRVCEEGYYPENVCSTFCEEVKGNSTCDEEGNKVCEENHYPDKDCSTFCDGLKGNYTCNTVTGEKICEEGKTDVNCDQCENGKLGHDCDKCEQHYFGEECQIFCKPQEHYHCSLEGDMICIDNTASVVNSCRHVDSSTDIIVIGGAGGGLLLIVLIIVIIVRCKRGRNKDITEEIGGEEGIDPTQDNQEQEALYSRINQQQIELRTEEDQDVYSRLNNKDTQHNKQKKDNRSDRRQGEIDQDPIYSTVDKQKEDEASQMYAQVERPGRSNEPQHLQSRTSADDGDTYADVTFVTNRRGQEAAVYRNQRVNNVENRREVTYSTVSEMIEQQL